MCKKHVKLNVYFQKCNFPANDWQASRAVIPGFYGLGKDGNVKTFSRGGSDVTGSIVAQACKADIYENWTDVSGFLVADPRIVDDPISIRYITYRELPCSPSAGHCAAVLQ